MKSELQRLPRLIRWASLGVLLAGLGVADVAGQAVAAGRPDGPDSWTAGTPWTGEAAVDETTGQIMARDRAVGLTLQGLTRIRPLRRSEDVKHLPANPDSPRATRWPLVPLPAPPPAPGEGPAFTFQSLGLSFTGATLADTGAFPPDSMGAAGPAQFLVGVNGRIRTFSKATGLADGVLNVDTDVFFASVMTPPTSTNFTSDPRVRYDRLSGRWFIIMIDVPGGSGTLPNRVMIAVSDGGTIAPSTVWHYFYFQQDLVSPTGDTGQFADYPTLGIDANALYIGVNIFSSSGSFQNTTAFVVRKSSILGTGPIVVTAFRQLIPNGNNGGPYTPQGVDNYDPAATEGYIIGVNSRFYGRLSLRRVSNPGTTPAISGNITITIPLNGGTITVPHLGNTGGTNGYLDGLDYQLMMAHLHNGRLWTCENMAVDNTGSPSGTDTRDAVRWYELQGIGSPSTPSVVQSGTLYQPSASNTTDQRHYWMGSVMVSGQGHMALGCSSAGTNEYANAAIAGRLATDALGTLRTPVLYTASTTAYNPPNDPGGAYGRRWGDYSYTSLDPSDDMTMWTIQEFCNATNSYGVQVVKILAPQPTLDTLNTGGCQGAAVSFSMTGTGFYDPGPGFNRLGVAISGSGVATSSVTYNGPTSVSVTVNVGPAAAPGPRDVTLTNPDGQTAVATGGFVVRAATSITQAPVSQATCVGTTVAFNVTATGDPGAPGLSYSWLKGGVPIPGPAGTSATLTLNNVQLGDAGSYTVIVTAGCGSVQSSPPALLTVVARSPADFNQDCHVDQADFNLFDPCFSGSAVPLSPGCEAKDLDGDGDVDPDDFGIFQRCFSGPNVLADPSCAY